ncbi:MAG TPA: endonuclease/exonuclease/phosphatase family protein [Polyangiaceae bacterium]|nr:endonuclease/exonuclease/phosphatase family protein [Polyangiaceae bacterium]
MRVATWNIRWFPDAVLEPERGAPGTDIQWLTCAVTALDAPVLAVQEFRSHEQARKKTRELLQALDVRTGGNWKVELDACPGEGTHVGFIYDAARVHAGEFRTVSALSATGSCEQGQHPGLAGRFDFGAFDATLVSVHFMWGYSTESLRLRREARARLGSVVENIARETGDDEVIVLGDFNTNGTRDVRPALTMQAEVEELATVAAGGSMALHLLPADQRCTQIEPDGRVYPLDHVLLTQPAEERLTEDVARVGGLCALTACSKIDPKSTAHYRRLSDHCPVSIEFGSPPARQTG